MPLYTNEAIAALPIIDPRRLDAGYLYWALRVADLTAGLDRAAKGLTLNKPKLLAAEIPVPPITEQRRIAAALDRAEELRGRRHRGLSLLSELQQALFVDCFGDPVDNPKCWPTQSLGQLLERAKLFTDGDWVESKDQDPGGDVRLVQLADVGDGVYLDKSSRYLTMDTAHRLRCTFLQSGDLLVARLPDPLGRACVFPGDQRMCVTVVDVCVIRPHEEGPEPVWLMNCLNMPAFRQQIARQATGTTRERISRGNLARLQIISPPASAQRDFVRKASSLDALRATVNRSLTSMDELLASLTAHAFADSL